MSVESTDHPAQPGWTDQGSAVPREAEQRGAVRDSVVRDSAVPDSAVPGGAEQLRQHECSRYRAAAAHARRVYPGPVGELVARELAAYADFGYRFTADALIPQLATQVLATPSRQPIVPAAPARPDAA